MAGLPWDILFAQRHDAPDKSRPISASPGKAFVSATKIESVNIDGAPVLVYGADVPVSVEFWQLQFHERLRQVMLAVPATAEFAGRTLAWCRFPYRADLMECSRFVRGRNRDEAWREAQLALVADEADPVARLKCDGVNVVDSSSKRMTALFGSPVRRHREVLLDDIAQTDAARRGPQNKRRFDKVIWLDELRTHPDQVAQYGPAASQAAETRWATLPSLAPQESEELVPHETPDFTHAKARLLAESPLVELLDEAQRGVLHLFDERVQLHEAVKDRAERILEYAAERALCGPRDTAGKGSVLRVSHLAHRIARYELHNQNRRWREWGGVIVSPEPPSLPQTPVPAPQAFEEQVEDLRYARDEGIGGIGNDVLMAWADRFLEKSLEPAEMVRACAALVLLLELPHLRPKVANHLKKLAAIAAAPGSPPGLVQIVRKVLGAAGALPK